METRTLIIIGIVVILVASSSFIALTFQQTSQQCELLGGKIAGLFSCSDKYSTPSNEPKTGSDCRMIFGKGTTEIYDCLEKIEKVVDPQELTNVYPRIHISILPDSDTELHYVDPDFVTIGPGSQVTWSNYDDVPISLNSIDPDNPWSTAIIPPDGYDTLTFDETGIYEYRGSPEIHGFIIVMDDDDSTRHHRDFYFSDWYDQNELSSAGCDKPILSHLSIYSNLLDGEFNGTFNLDWMGLSDGVSEEQFEKCVDFIYEKRISVEPKPILISTNRTEYVTIASNSFLSVEVMCPTDNPYPSNYQILFDKVPYDTKVQGVQHVSGDRDGTEYNGFIFDFENPTNESESATIQVNCSVTPEPRTEPGPIPDSESLQQQKQQQGKLDVQKVILADYRTPQYNIRAINDYRSEFESGYFLEQFIFSNKQNYEKDDEIHFIFAEWGYQETECTSPKVEVYLRSYENYSSIEKISEWQKTEEECYSVDSDFDGYLITNIRHMPGIFEPHDTCTIPGEYRVITSNLEDESKKEYGYYTCQKEKLVGEPQPWMELPE